jgi:hypothetical protein
LGNGKHFNSLSTKPGDEVQVTLDVVVARDGELRSAEDGRLKEQVVSGIAAELERTAGQCLDRFVGDSVKDVGEVLVA